ncbi:MAG TPA: hypothetical protein VKB62_00330 [Streptosporangiaceae bacterium]|nr:hypothetical protein [Streptosporangiaceae bacterium]
MGLMDRVKAQATQLAQQAQEAAQEGKARLDQAQAGRRGDMLLRQLGALVYAERTGRGTSESQARIEQLINEISEHERQNGLNLTDPPQPGFGQSLFGQSVFGQASSGQPPADQGAGEQSGSGQSGEGQADAGQADPAQTPPPAGAAGEMPGVDTTTSFFPAPDDDGAGGPPQG